MRREKNKAVYKKLIHTLRVGFLALDDDVRQKIIDFLQSQQHINGAFADRAANPDVYYSLFGMWLSAATDQNGLLNRLKSFIETRPEQSPSPVEALALLLIKSELTSNPQKQSLLKIGRIVFRKGRSIDLSYQFFLLALVVDAVGKNKHTFYFLARIWLFFYKPHKNIPCSLASALLFAQNMFGLNTRNMQNRVSDFIVDSGGFKAFDSVDSADMLSTGVALFVLKEIGYDTRLIKPACLDFIQDNYRDGAFLSGDGDATKDLEYTFYGLLALGSLLKETSHS